MRRLIVAVLLLVSAVAVTLLVSTNGTDDAGTHVTAPASQSSGTAGSGTSGSGGAGSGAAGTGQAVQNPSGLPEVKESALPPEARETLALIRADGPYPFRQDDETFGNFERILPREASGYYREYTVKTPGQDSRGARRIVAGGNGEKYYTEDHYESFRFIAEGS